VARSPKRLAVEGILRAASDYIPDAIERPLRRALSVDAPRVKPKLAAKPTKALAVPRPAPKPLALPAPPKPLALPAPSAGLPSFAAKPKGGQWWVNKDLGHSSTSPEAAASLGAYPLAIENWVPEAADGARGYIDRQPSPAQQWMERALTKYYKNDFGTPDDPLRDLAARGLHYDSDMTPERWQEQVNSYLTQDPIGDVTLPKNLYRDDVYPGVGDEFTTEARMAMPWLAKLPVTDKIYGISNGGLDLNHFTDEFMNAIGDPGSSGLPMDFAIRPESLSRMTFPQAVEHVGKINQFRAKEMERAALSSIDNPAVQTFKEYGENNPMGLRWTELKAPEPSDDLLDDRDRGLVDLAVKEGRTVDPAHMDAVRTSRARKALEDALRYEGDAMGHCVGGYCDDVVSGRSQIFSLRDAKGEPHVTIETSPFRGRIPDDVAKKIEEQVQNDADIVGLSYDPNVKDRVFWDTLTTSNPFDKRINELQDEWKANAPSDIVQIKGKQNRAPKDDYLPFVQDFVKSGQWGNIGDMKNTGLVKLPDGRYITSKQYEDVISGDGLDDLYQSWRFDAGRFPRHPTVMDKDDWEQFQRHFEGYAVGGRVAANRCFSKGKSAVYAVDRKRK